MLTERPSYYASCYCEENVWRLLHDSRLEGEHPHALFIANALRSFPMWAQRSAEPPSEPVLWDYHVVAVAWREECEVWDLDSQRSFPCSASSYLAASFPMNDRLRPEARPRFRLVPRAPFVAHFASDRSHMRAPDGTCRMPPPALPAIRTEGETMNLWSWVDTEAPFVGEVFDLPGLLARLGGGFS